MFQTADGKMILSIYLAFVTCITAHAADVPIVFPNSNTASNGNIGNTTQSNENIGNATQSNGNIGNTTQSKGNIGNITQSNGNIGKVYDKLFLAEELIQSAKEIVLKNKQALQPTDCEDLLNSGETKSGVYSVWPMSRILTGPVSVYCDMDTDGGGWTVIQRRGDFLRPQDYFNKDWNTYKNGFGNLKEEFWLGNDNIFALTSQKLYSIRIDLGAPDGSKAYALFSKFWIDDEDNSYKLHVTEYSGTAGDSFTHHNSYMFSTKDRDNDVDPGSCAGLWKSGWWFTKCMLSNLNGQYIKGTSAAWQGIIWNAWKGSLVSLRTTEMKIRKLPSWIK